MTKPRTAGAKNISQLHAIYKAVCESPGIRAYSIAKKLNTANGTIYSAMASMDLAGFLVSQDGCGGLHPFRAIEQQNARILWEQTRR